jgi:hypothetical protein
MKFRKMISLAIIAGLSSAAVLDTRAASSQLDEAPVVSKIGVAFAPTNDIDIKTYNGGRQSATEHHAQKSRRMAERRARVIAAITAASASNDDVNNLQYGAKVSSNNNDNARSRFLSRMTIDDLEKSYVAAEASSKMHGLRGDEFNKGGEFIRSVAQELKNNEDTLRNEGRKLWGNGGNLDPYESWAGSAEETGYYGKCIRLVFVVWSCRGGERPKKQVGVTIKHYLFLLFRLKNKHRQVATGVPFSWCVH